jgi:uncharacterized protein with HEPN domain
MLPERISSSLLHILDSIDAIFDYLGTRRDFKAYKANRQLRRSVEREMEIIGEAANRIKKADPDFPLKNIRKIIDFRNLVAHAYDSVNDEIVWMIVVKYLPKLRKDVAKLLS